MTDEGPVETVTAPGLHHSCVVGALQRPTIGYAEGMDIDSEPTQGNAMDADEAVGATEPESGGSLGDTGEDVGALTGTATSADEADPSYAGAGTPDDGDVQEDPGSQVSG
jgi:hypothetical protein